nr:GNAT family protein [Kofleriaceae bacterium]
MLADRNARRPPLVATDRLVLRELRVADAAGVAAGAGDPRVAKFLVQVPSPYPVALAKRWVTSRIAWWYEARGATLAIATRDDPNAMIGTASLRRSPSNRRAELGYWLAAGAWGRGYATEACRAMLELGFGQLGLVRVFAHVIAGNGASCRVLDKLGMVCEGVQRSHIRKDGERRDLVMYGLLKDEWTTRGA